MNTHHQVVEEKIITAHQLEDSSSPIDPESFKKNYSVEQIYTVAPLSQYQVIPVTSLRNDNNYQEQINLSSYSGPAYLLTTAADGTQQLQPLQEHALNAETEQIQIENVQTVDVVPETAEETVLPGPVPTSKIVFNSALRKNRPFKCDQCTASYLDSSELEEHKSKHTDDGPFTCVDCHFTFMFKSHYRSHRTRCEKKRAQTPVTNKPFVIECRSGKHKFPKNFVKKQTPMPQQEVTYLSLDSINQSSKKLNQNTVKQSQNSTRFNPKNPNFKRTRRVGRADRPFECDECDATFKIDSDLKTHKLKHTGGGPFKCEECEFVFLFRKLYDSHQRRCTKKNYGISLPKKPDLNESGLSSTIEQEQTTEPLHQLETVSLPGGSSANYISIQSPMPVYNQPTIMEMRPTQTTAGIIPMPHSVFDQQNIATTSANHSRSDIKYELVPTVELDGISMNQIVNMIKVKAPSQ